MNRHLTSCWKNVQREIFRASQAEKVERLLSARKGLGFQGRAAAPHRAPAQIHRTPARRAVAVAPALRCDPEPAGKGAGLGTHTFCTAGPRGTDLDFLSVTE